jgi:hypothetical protein
VIGCRPIPGGPGPRLQRLADPIGAGNFTGTSIDALVTIARRELAAMIPTASGSRPHGWPPVWPVASRDSTATKASA